MRITHKENRKRMARILQSDGVIAWIEVKCER